MEQSIPEKEFEQRVKNTRSNMEKEGIKCLIAFSSYPEREGHLEYLTNYHGAFPPSQYDEVYRGLGYSALVLTQSDGPILFSGLLFATGRLFGVEKVDSSPDLPLAVSRLVSKELRKDGKSTVGLAGSDVIPSLYLKEIKKNIERKKDQVKFAVADKILIDQRAVKSELEQRILRRGAEIADAGIEAAFHATKPGAREMDLGLAAARVCYEEGADYVARTRIYGRGVSSVRWPIMTNRRLEKGEITGIDLVGFYNSYGFDVLRVWTVGEPSSTQRASLKDAAALTEETSKSIRAGMTGDEVSERTIEVAKELGLEPTKVSPFGHAIGLEIVENPFLLPKASTKIKAGAFLCVEPGIELASHQSVHFEDEIMIGKNGRSESVSNIRKDFF